MLPIILLSTIAAVQAVSLPRQDAAASSPAAVSGGSPVFIACVQDAKIPSLTQSIAVNASSREECSVTCSSSSSQHDLAFFRQDTLECYCSSSADAPTSDEIVYATDELGNCRSQDDASVEYLHSTYKFSECVLPPLTPSTSNFSTSDPIECLKNCSNSSSTIVIRPEYDGDNDKFEYDCQCYDSTQDQIQTGQKTDCGFGIESIYTKA
ncbi:uncharacterized protein L201_001020 [Kwoniella dendrophila CBS 6074]|uniref:WSC domain-containing protein n=1 Tax=Kwoniella dendrophila CBS 6074 TaxID=1295534 RepID=A0AAX4JL62_9TREE